MIDRRYVFYSVAGLVLNAVLGKLPFGIEQRAKVVAESPGFVIINGWVLTREDVAASKLTRNVI